MGTENSVLRKRALEALKGNWLTAIMIFVVWGFLISIGTSIDAKGEASGASIISLLLAGPLAYGISRVSLAYARHQQVEFSILFDGFKNYVDTFLAYLYIIVFTFLWGLLLIIPGIIKSISYSMTFFILVDNPGIKPMDAIDKSMVMMDGYKMKFFLMSLLFFLLSILSGILLFIPLLWLIPYMYVTFAEFYEDLKGNTAFIQQ